MAIELPKSRLGVRQIATQKRKVPLEQIIAVQGQSPIATGIETAGAVIGQALSRRAELQRQGQQLAQLETLSGQAPGTYSGLDPSIATSFATQQIKQRNENFNQAQMEAIARGDLTNMASVFPSGVPKEAVTSALSGSRSSNLEDDREIRRKERRSNERTVLVNRFNSDKSVQKSQQSIDAANIIRELATSGNPIAAGAIPTYMARASGEVGNLSEADKAPFGGSRSILSRLEASLTQAATGQLTPDNAQFIMQLSDLMEARASNNMDNLARTRSKQYSNASDFLNENEILFSLRPEIQDQTNPNKKSKQSLSPIPTGEEIERMTKDGRVAIFDSKTKTFLRYK